MVKDYIGLKIDPEIKRRFLDLAESEKLTVTDAIELLILEALKRGYIDKTRHDLFAKKEALNEVSS
jgi:hypothetical protein